MDREFYIKEAIRQLSDTKFYKSCKENLTLEHHSLVQDLVTELFNKKLISEQTFKFLFYWVEKGLLFSIYFPKFIKI